MKISKRISDRYPFTISADQTEINFTLNQNMPKPNLPKEANRLIDQSPWRPLTFVVLQGLSAAITAVTRINLTWLVSQTQTNMSLRVVLQMISGTLAIILAPLAANTAKRAGGAWLVAGLALLVVPVSLWMALVVSQGEVSAAQILAYGVAMAIIVSFSFSAHEEFLCHLARNSANPSQSKAVAVRLRNTVQFFGRIIVWIGLALGALSIKGVQAAKTTYFLEAGFMVLFGLVIVVLLRTHRATATNGIEPNPISEAPSSSRKETHSSFVIPSSQETERPREPWQWNHPLIGIFTLEFSLNCFFVGAIMLPKLLPDKSLSTLYIVMAVGALGSIFGTIFTRMTKVSLWTFVLLDIITLLFTYTQHTTIGIAIGWCVANACYGATDTIFARAVQAGTSARAANLASIRRIFMAGVLNFSVFGLFQAQSFLMLSDRGLCYLSVGLTVIVVLICWTKRKWIHQAFEVAVRT